MSHGLKELAEVHPNWEARVPGFFDSRSVPKPASRESWFAVRTDKTFKDQTLVISYPRVLIDLPSIQNMKMMFFFLFKPSHWVTAYQTCQLNSVILNLKPSYYIVIWYSEKGVMLDHWSNINLNNTYTVYYICMLSGRNSYFYTIFKRPTAF